MYEHSLTIFEAQIWYIKNDNPKKLILTLAWYSGTQTR